MKSTAHKKLGGIAVLSLLALLAIVIGAQAAFAGSGSTPVAGTQGRGGVSVAGFAALATTPAAGTQGRGGVAPASVTAVAVTTPAAGTQGRGGIAAVSGSATPAQAAAPATVGSGLTIHSRGGVPRPVSGTLAAPAAAASTSSFGVWLAVGIAAAVLLLGIVAWVSYRRRGARAESSLAAFCALHPDDAACMSA